MKEIAKINSRKKSSMPVMNWKKAFSLAVDNLKGELYVRCSKVYSANEAMFSEIYERVTENYNITTIESINDLKTTKFSDLIVETMKLHQDEIVECMNEAYEFSQKAPFIILDTCLSMSRPTPRDIMLIQKRTSLTHKAMVAQIEYFLRETVETFSNNMEDYLESLTESLEFLEKLESEENDISESLNPEVKEEKFNYKKIYCYKEMEKLAKNNGYTYKWSNGSHNIYEHPTSNKIVVIPAHDLGLGLSIKIQKQILNNAC